MSRMFIALAALLSLAGVLAVVLQPSDAGVPLLRTAESGAPTATPPPLLRGIRPVEPSKETAEDGPLVPSPEMEEIEDDELITLDAAPPDPVQRGTCVLALELVSDTDETPFDTQLDLYRIGEPGNAGWLAGDRKIENVEATKGRVDVPRLAPGRYRIHAHRQRKGSEDPAAFEVGGDRTEVRLVLPVPRRFDVRLRIYDVAGRLVERAQKQSGGGGSSSTQPDTPDWVKERALRKGLLDRDYSSWIGCGCGPGLGAKKDITAVNGTFHVLRAREPERYNSRSSTWYVHAHGTKFSIHAGRDTTRDLTYVAVVPPLNDLHDTVRLPDGRRAVDAGATLTATCTPVLVPQNGREPGFRDIPIQVQVRLKGYADLDFEHTLASPATDRVLEVP